MPWKLTRSCQYDIQPISKDNTWSISTLVWEKFVSVVPRWRECIPYGEWVNLLMSWKTWLGEEKTTREQSLQLRSSAMISYDKWISNTPVTCSLSSQAGASCLFGYFTAWRLELDADCPVIPWQLIIARKCFSENQSRHLDSGCYCSRKKFGCNTCDEVGDNEF